MSPKEHKLHCHKVSAIVDILASSGRPMSYSEVLAASGFAKSSTHRLLSILQNEGVIEFDERNKTYALGQRLRGWARQSWINSDLQRQSANELEKLCESCGHNVCLMGMDGARTLVLSAIHPYQVPYAAKMGEYAAAHCTAGGKVLIAYLREKAATTKSWTTLTLNSTRRIRLRIVKSSRPNWRTSNATAWLWLRQKNSCKHRPSQHRFTTTTVRL